MVRFAAAARIAVLAAVLATLVLACSSNEEEARCDRSLHYIPALDVQFEELVAWEGLVMNWRVDDGCEVEDRDFRINDDDHHASADVQPDGDLFLEAWIDLDGDGAYDAPPTDASWRVLASYDWEDHELVLRAASTQQVDLGGW